jgi:hypothetical protein
VLLACVAPVCLQIKRMDMEARSLSQDKSKQLLSKVGDHAASRS